MGKEQSKNGKCPNLPICAILSCCWEVPHAYLMSTITIINRKAINPFIDTKKTIE
jgi:hypothetical protein